MRLTETQRRDWLRLIRTEGIGPKNFQTLINRFGGAAAAIEALPELTLRRVGRRITPVSPAAAEAELEALDRIGATLIAQGEPDYPSFLLHIDAPPPLIAVRGRLDLLQRPAIGIVGSRNASALARRFATQLARGLAGEGIIVVSGLARGIDGAAHEGALAEGTIAALAGGIDQIYPPEHAALHGEIGMRGVLVSEMPFGWIARAQDFPRRNRIIAGLSLGVVVVEAARRSGSLITARLAREAGREVFAVPGSPLDPRAEGTNDLIKNGAILVRHLTDILEELQPQLGREPVSGIAEADLVEVDQAERKGDRTREPLWEEVDLFGATDALTARSLGGDPAVQLRGRMEVTESPCTPRDRLWSALGTAPVGIDELARASGLDIRSVTVLLIDMEADGTVARSAEGGYLRAVNRANRS